MTGPDAVRMHGLIAAMPPVARAEQGGPNGTAGQDPSRLVDEALDVLVDTRRRLYGILADGRDGER